ncbi:hypothetical protein HanPI659440_Chr10g0402091 [Helianthus annuus]|nr:hypothetical protein HanPI659440_Chr10g0402091 [Helianthus annuus]
MGSSGITKVGGELMDLISLGAGCSAAVGPVGRVLEASGAFAGRGHCCKKDGHNFSVLWISIFDNW